MNVLFFGFRVSFIETLSIVVSTSFSLGRLQSDIDNVFWPFGNAIFWAICSVQLFHSQRQIKLCEIK